MYVCMKLCTFMLVALSYSTVHIIACLTMLPNGSVWFAGEHRVGSLFFPCSFQAPGLVFLEHRQCMRCRQMQDIGS